MSLMRVPALVSHTPGTSQAGPAGKPGRPQDQGEEILTLGNQEDRLPQLLYLLSPTALTNLQ